MYASVVELFERRPISQTLKMHDILEIFFFSTKLRGNSTKGNVASCEVDEFLLLISPGYRYQYNQRRRDPPPSRRLPAGQPASPLLHAT